MSPASAINLALRVVMELGVVAGFAYWGVHSADSVVGKVLLGVAAPAAGFGIWGAVDFRGAGDRAELLRLGEELAISGLAALALATSGQLALGIALIAISIVHHVLVYAIGDRLLKAPPGAASAS